MAGLLGDVLPWVYSQGDRLKRGLNGLLDDPMGSMAQTAGDIQDKHRTLQGLLDQVQAGDRGKPLQQATDMAMNGLQGFAPVGMVIGPQSAALETARRNAVKMLGLPENNTAMDRARAMGFYDDWKHGSPNPNIQAFDPKRAGERGADFGPATFATKNGDNASGYALNWKSYEATKKADPVVAAADQDRAKILAQIPDAFAAGDKAKVEALKQALKTTHQPGADLYDNFLNYKIPSEGSTVYPLMIRADDMPWVDGGRRNFSQVNGKAIDEARAAGKPGVRINEVQDNSGRFGGTSDVMAVFQPNMLRSRFAAFDPARSLESDLLGRADPRLLGLLGAGAAGAAYYNSDR